MSFITYYKTFLTSRSFPFSSRPFVWLTSETIRRNFKVGQSLTGVKETSRHILCFVQTLVSAIHQIKFIIIKWISIRKNNCIVLWLSIYPVDSANPPFDQLEPDHSTEEDNVSELWSGRELDKIRWDKITLLDLFTISLQLTPNNSNLQGKSKKVRVIGSSKKIAGF